MTDFFLAYGLLLGSSVAAMVAFVVFINRDKKPIEKHKHV